MVAGRVWALVGAAISQRAIQQRSTPVPSMTIVLAWANLRHEDLWPEFNASTWARSAAGHSQSKVSSQSGFGDIGIMLQYADRQDYAEHEGWRYLVKNQELF